MADKQNTLFRAELRDLFDILSEFRAWISQRKKTNVGFMKAYKQKLRDEIGPVIRQFQEKYGNREERQLKAVELVLQTFACLSRPIAFMETKLRPSVGLGVWQERWMMTSAVEDYLKECCREVDHHLNDLKQKMTSL